MTAPRALRPFAQRPRRAGARLAPGLRPAVRRRPIRASAGPRRRGRIALAALAALALFLLWPREPPPRTPPGPPPKAAMPARPHPRAARPAPSPPKPAPLSPRERLLAAIRERAADLAACETAPGSPTRAPTRLRITRAGVPVGVAFEGIPLPPALAGCMRERILAWRFDGLDLPADVEVLVSFSLAARL